MHDDLSLLARPFYVCFAPQSFRINFFHAQTSGSRMNYKKILVNYEHIRERAKYSQSFPLANVIYEWARRRRKWDGIKKFLLDEKC